MTMCQELKGLSVNTSAIQSAPGCCCHEMGKQSQDHGSANFPRPGHGILARRTISSLQPGHRAASFSVFLLPSCLLLACAIQSSVGSFPSSQLAFPQSWSRSERPSMPQPFPAPELFSVVIYFEAITNETCSTVDATRKVGVMSSPFDAPTALGARQRTKQSKGSPSETWLKAPPFVRLILYHLGSDKVGLT